ELDVSKEFSLVAPPGHPPVTASFYPIGYRRCDDDSCVVLDARISPMPEHLTVYRLANTMTKERAAAIARSVKMNGTLSENETGYRLLEDRRSLYIDKYSGRVEYEDRSEWTSPDPLSVADSVPS